MRWPWSKCSDLEDRIVTLERVEKQKTCRHIDVRVGPPKYSYSLSSLYYSAKCNDCDAYVSNNVIIQRLTPKKDEENK